MSWREVGAVDSRLCFIAEYLRSELPVGMICARHGISRKTGYKWLSRFLALGASGLDDRGSAPHSRPQTVPLAFASLILSLRRARPSWGPRKLLAQLALEHPGHAWPAASTVGDLLRREGLVIRKARTRRAQPGMPALIVAERANDSWSADFKGWFRTGDGVRCEPLTITDNCSRYLIAAQAVPRPTFAEIKPLFIQAFREHGLPRSLRTDNGSPFASRTALAGLSQFSVWLLTLGVWPERIMPGRPDQNGRHERMHRTLNQDAASPREATIAAQQKRMDDWRHDFNTSRPHEALGQRYPAACYVRSERPWIDPAPYSARRFG